MIRAMMGRAGRTMFLLISVTFLHILKGERNTVMARTDSIQAKIEARLAERSDEVFLTREFNDLGDKRQVLRGLSNTVRDGKLIRIGYGIYGRATRSALTGQPILAARQGFAGASQAALTKLGITWQVTELERAYIEGRSTQIPANAVVQIKGRFSRKISYRGKPLVIQR